MQSFNCEAERNRFVNVQFAPVWSSFVCASVYLNVYVATWLRFNWHRMNDIMMMIIAVMTFYDNGANAVKIRVNERRKTPLALINKTIDKLTNLIWFPNFQPSVLPSFFLCFLPIGVCACVFVAILLSAAICKFASYSLICSVRCLLSQPDCQPANQPARP